MDGVTATICLKTLLFGSAASDIRMTDASSNFISYWGLLEQRIQAKARPQKGGCTKTMKGNDEVRMVAEEEARDKR